MLQKTPEQRSEVFISWQRWLNVTTFFFCWTSGISQTSPLFHFQPLVTQKCNLKAGIPQWWEVNVAPGSRLGPGQSYSSIYSESDCSRSFQRPVVNYGWGGYRCSADDFRLLQGHAISTFIHGLFRVIKHICHLLFIWFWHFWSSHEDKGQSK